MNIAVIGLGGIGKRHVGNFRTLGCEVRAWDINPNAWGELDCIRPTLGEALDGADGVVIATPPDSHMDLAGRWMLPRPSVAVMIGIMMLMAGELKKPDEMRRFIEGFN